MSPNHRNRPFRSSRRRGFTLLEIIVVVTIIALLATLVAPRVLGRIGKSKQMIAKSEVESIAQQISLWMVDHGHSRLPDDFSIEMLAEGKDPYLRSSDLEDPWGRLYIVVVPGNINPDYDVMSYGADGQQGGEGEDGDVVNGQK